VASEEAAQLLAQAGEFTLGDHHFSLDRATHEKYVRRIKDSIRAGDTYQVNLTAPVRFALFGDPLGFYRAVRARQRVPYGAFLRLSAYHLCSFSPELFFRIDGRTITARPMKGTSPRGASPDEDDRMAEALRADEKNRAENLMIVDLLRNDLSRVTEAGSVRVPRLFEAERYETLTQMTSSVTATLRPEAGVGDVFRALFPCGSVTGAPKLRAMQLIRELEDAPRGIYCGAIGYAGPKASETIWHGESQSIEAVFSVPIRTAEIAEDCGRLGVGSGIVWDSEAGAEYEECLLKARFLTGLTV
jgi:para-aminobenzoate synthetase/4-amino-4-deoxychorismate lyase